MNYSNFLTHIIEFEDDYYKLSNQYNVSIKSLIDANPDVNPDFLYKGQRISIPVERFTDCEELRRECDRMVRQCQNRQPDRNRLNVSGVWDTTFGQMILQQMGQRVTGTYTHDNGRISGILNRNMFAGTWSESPTYRPPNDSGSVILTFQPSSFSGFWGYGDEQPNKTWSGTRISR